MELRLGKISVDTYNRQQAMSAIDQLVTDGNGGKVFTANVDHVILAQENDRFATAYRWASIRLADGMPIVWASRLFKEKIPERVAGSDILLPLLELACNKGYSVCFLGSTTEVLDAAALNAKEKFPALKIVGMMSPQVSSTVTEIEVIHIMRDVARVKPDIIIVALGAPKQEIFIDLATKYYPGAVFFGLGASLDFLAGKVQRAPVWMQKMGLEWSYRLYSEPKRLYKRYLRDMKFPFIVLKQALNR